MWPSLEWCLSVVYKRPSRVFCCAWYAREKDHVEIIFGGLIKASAALPSSSSPPSSPSQNPQFGNPSTSLTFYTIRLNLLVLAFVDIKASRNRQTNSQPGFPAQEHCTYEQHDKNRRTDIKVSVLQKHDHAAKKKSPGSISCTHHQT